MARPFVLLVSIDGFADFYWRDERVKAPTLRALAERGVVADGVTAVFPSTTWPTHVSLVTGVRPARRAPPPGPPARGRRPPPPRRRGQSHPQSRDATGRGSHRRSDLRRERDPRRAHRL